MPRPTPHPVASGRIGLSRAAALAVALLAGCDSSNGQLLLASSSSAAGSAGPPPAGPVPGEDRELRHELTFPRQPAGGLQRHHANQEMLALGLGASMVGTFGVSGDGRSGQPVPPPAVPGGVPVGQGGLGRVLQSSHCSGLRPDFMFARLKLSFEAGARGVQPQDLASFGIKSLALTESCAHVQHGQEHCQASTTLHRPDQPRRDLRGPAAGGRMVHRMKRGSRGPAEGRRLKPGVGSVRLRQRQRPPYTAPGLATPDALISLAGGSNLSTRSEQSWTSVSWEQVTATRAPVHRGSTTMGRRTAKQKRSSSSTSRRRATCPRSATDASCASPTTRYPAPRNADRGLRGDAEVVHLARRSGCCQAQLERADVRPPPRRRP